MTKMYYDRVLSPKFAQLLEIGGELRWLFDFVKERPDLDLLIGKNNDIQWISVYRGLSRCVTINEKGKINGAKAYKQICPDLYGSNLGFEKELKKLLSIIEKEPKFDRYYKNKKAKDGKEGYFQNEFSRKYGILSNPNSEFVIIDKEVVIGYDNDETREKLLTPHKEKYKKMFRKISSINPKRYGSTEKRFGNELDFLALDKNGNIRLIEFKHGGKKCNTSGIYLSPLQIGLYYDIFTEYYKKHKEEFEDVIFKMLEQKQKIGLINPEWQCPKPINKIIPVLVISEYNYDCSAHKKYDEIMNICKKEFRNNFLSNIVTHNFTGLELEEWNL